MTPRLSVCTPITMAIKGVSSQLYAWHLVWLMQLTISRHWKKEKETEAVWGNAQSMLTFVIFPPSPPWLWVRVRRGEHKRFVSICQSHLIDSHQKDVHFDALKNNISVCLQVSFDWCPSPLHTHSGMTLGQLQADRGKDGTTICRTV